MEREELERGGNPAAPELDERDPRARLIGEIVAEAVAGLGAARAMLPAGVVKVAPAASGRQPGRPRERESAGDHATGSVG